MNAQQNRTNLQLTSDMFARLGAPHIVYVRELAADEARKFDGIAAGARLYAIHAADGTPVGVMENRDAAFATARENDMEPVSVH
jgi:hypothetical protein